MCLCVQMCALICLSVVSLLVGTGEMVHITASGDRGDGTYHC